MLILARASRVLTSGPIWFQSVVLCASTFVVYLLTAWYGSRQNTDRKSVV